MTREGAKFLARARPAICVYGHTQPAQRGNRMRGSCFSTLASLAPNGSDCHVRSACCSSSQTERT
jgi:hypothetical protein